MSPTGQLTAIVPAYNEAPTLGAIVKTLVDSHFFHDVIVITDGSTDGSPDIARRAGASIVLHDSIRRGKGLAMRRAAGMCRTPLIFFLDGDLIGLRRDHLATLIEPVVSGQCVMSVGLRDRGVLITWFERFLPLIGGERVLSKRMFDGIPEKFLYGYRVEVAMNAYCKSHGLSIGRFALHGLRIRRKMQKIGVLRGAFSYLAMTWEMLDAFWMTRLATLMRKW